MCFLHTYVWDHYFKAIKPMTERPFTCKSFLFFPDQFSKSTIIQLAYQCSQNRSILAQKWSTMALQSESNDQKSPIRIDFLSEFYYKNCQHIIDNILGQLCPVTLLRCSSVCQTWKIILKQSANFPHDISQLFYRYHAKNSFPIEDLHSGHHLSNYQAQWSISWFFLNFLKDHQQYSINF